MTSLNFKGIGLTRPGSKPAGSGLEPVIFRFPDLPEREVVALLIWPPQLLPTSTLIQCLAFYYLSAFFFIVLHAVCHVWTVVVVEAAWAPVHYIQTGQQIWLMGSQSVFTHPDLWPLNKQSGISGGASQSSFIYYPLYKVVKMDEYDIIYWV